MKKSLITGVLLLISGIILNTAGNAGGNTTAAADNPAPASEWDSLVEALIWVESRGDASAVNPRTGATGILQIMPIYVKDANRLQNDTEFTLADRLSPEKSMEMFRIIQQHYNPGRDIHKAIHLHNPKAGQSYADAVLARMEEQTGHRPS